MVVLRGGARVRDFVHSVAPLGLLQYAYFHGLSHDWPALVPRIARHHAIHHLAPNMNQCISFSWPDRLLFRTHLSSRHAASIPVRVEPMLRGVPPTAVVYTASRLD